MSGLTAIPTVYRGVQFRSRLEAKWAAFFSALEWPWTYEPCDYDGWIPDFVLDFANPLLVEVKPILGTVDAEREADALLQTIVPAQEVLLLGTQLRRAMDFSMFPALGLLLDAGECRSWAEAVLFACSLCGGFSVLHSMNSWYCRRCGGYDGNGHIGLIDWNHINSLWAWAGNVTQWNAPANSWTRVGSIGAEMPARIHPVRRGETA